MYCVYVCFYNIKYIISASHQYHALSHSSVYWSVWGINPRIETSYIDGTHRAILVEKDVKWPTSLCFDHISRRLYWIDAKLKRIETVTVIGHDRTIVQHFYEGTLKQFKALLY